MDVFYWLWIAYFGFHLASLVISSLLKLWQVFRGKHKRYSSALFTEEIIGGVLNALALVGLWGFIHTISYPGVFGSQLFWRTVFWGLAALLLLQPLLPKSKLIYNKGGTNVTLISWLFMALWIMPLLWALWVYGAQL